MSGSAEVAKRYSKVDLTREHGSTIARAIRLSIRGSHTQEALSKSPELNLTCREEAEREVSLKYIKNMKISPRKYLEHSHSLARAPISKIALVKADHPNVLQPVEQRCLLLAAISCVIQCFPPQTKAEVPPDLIEIGFARISFNPSSSELTGPPGTTPPGAAVDLENTNTLGLLYERRLIGPFSLALQTGLPPLVKFFGKGTAVSLGEVGEARAWFPAVIGVCALPQIWRFAPYVGVGVNYTLFTGNQIDDSYTKAFGGTSSTGSLSRRTGAVGKVGTRFAIASRWALDLSYSRYWISTRATVETDTPGFGTITRRIGVTANPDVFGFSVAYPF